MREIYLDYNATTPLDPRVADRLCELTDNAFGNPSSTHWAGRPAREAVETARAQVAALLGCRPAEIVFTSGGSESNNLALKGVYFAAGKRDAHIITSAVEHPAIARPCQFLRSLGARITTLAVDARGRVDPAELARSITNETILVSIMHANNETGTVQPIAECAAIAREAGVLFHTDAAQSVGKIPTRVDELGVDLLTLAGHKLYAPKGCGALYVRTGTRLEPLIHGAGHESGRRAGTESAMLAAALGEACEIAGHDLPSPVIAALRDQLRDRLLSRFDQAVRINGDPVQCLPNTLNLSFVGRDGGAILAAMPEVAASTGSACHAGRTELSDVLTAMGVSEQVGMGAIRFSLGRWSTAEDVDAVVDRLTEIVPR